MTGKKIKKKEKEVSRKGKEEKKKAEKIEQFKTKNKNYENVKITPVAKKLMEENDLNVDDVITGLKRIVKKTFEVFLKNQNGK